MKLEMTELNPYATRRTMIKIEVLSSKFSVHDKKLSSLMFLILKPSQVPLSIYMGLVKGNL
jgi:hypothetical protein